MKPRIQSFFSLGILTMLAALTFWLERITQVGEVREDGKQRHDPDYFVENFNVKSFGANGNLENTLTALKMLHYPDDDTTVMTEPRISSFSNSRALHVSSSQGLVAADAREITLVNNVRVRREATETAPEAVLSTRLLTLFPDDEIMRTAVPVTITQGASVLNVAGLEVDNKTGRMQLHGPVTATIERKHR